EIHDDTRLLEGAGSGEDRSRAPYVAPAPELPNQGVRGREAVSTAVTSSPLAEPNSAIWGELQRRLSWIYPHHAATQQPAKASVTMLRRRAAEFADDESQTLFTAQSLPSPHSRSASLVTRHSSLDTGTAHHSFLQLVDLDRVGSLAGLKAEAQRLSDVN